MSWRLNPRLITMCESDCSFHQRNFGCGQIYQLNHLPRTKHWVVSVIFDSGNPIPYVDYTPEETATWTASMSKLEALYPLYACSQFNSSFSKLQFSASAIPQLEDISQILRAETGWQVVSLANFFPSIFFPTARNRYLRHCMYILHWKKPLPATIEIIADTRYKTC